MLIGFRGYAGDCTITGEVELAADRLKDLLDREATIVVLRATLCSLDDGREVCVPRLELPRDELLAAEADEPRGPAGRRILTVRHPALALVGPYEVRGDLHDRPGAPLMSGATGSRPTVSFTGATLRLLRAGREELHHASTLLVHGGRVAWVAPGAAEPFPDPLPSDAASEARTVAYTG